MRSSSIKVLGDQTVLHAAYIQPRQLAELPLGGALFYSSGWWAGAILTPELGLRVLLIFTGRWDVLQLSLDAERPMHILPMGKERNNCKKQHLGQAYKGEIKSQAADSGWIASELLNQPPPFCSVTVSAWHGCSNQIATIRAPSSPLCHQGKAHRSSCPCGRSQQSLCIKGNGETEMDWSRVKTQYHHNIN